MMLKRFETYIRLWSTTQFSSHWSHDATAPYTKQLPTETSHNHLDTQTTPFLTFVLHILWFDWFAYIQLKIWRAHVTPTALPLDLHHLVKSNKLPASSTGTAPVQTPVIIPETDECHQSCCFPPLLRHNEQHLGLFIRFKYYIFILNGWIYSVFHTAMNQCSFIKSSDCKWFFHIDQFLFFTCSKQIQDFR